TIVLLCTCILGRVSSTPMVKLSSGYEMPAMGFGTWWLTPDETEEVVTNALNSGYKYIDTAFIYGNEKQVGKAIRNYIAKGGKRKDLFVLTKLPSFGNRPEDVEFYMKLSLKNLGLKYIDMYLIHEPLAVKRNHETPESNLPFLFDKDGHMEFDYNIDHLGVWKQMEKQVRAGRTKSIGISNFNSTQIMNIMNHAEIMPSNLQIETQLYNQQRKMRKFCAENNIVLTAYSSLGGSPDSNFAKTPNAMDMGEPLNNPVVRKIAENRNMTTAQILLRHLMQEGLVVIPKSRHPDRIKSNREILNLQLSEFELKQLDNLDLGEDGRIYDTWNIFG
ncbi:hypothetical protein QAD02_023753, partial [Eretmocerus hayati]